MKVPAWLKRRRAKPVDAAPVPTAHSRRVEGDAARAARDWPAAASAYGAAFELEPTDGAIAVQWGHALKEDGRFDAAEQAYRQAAYADPSLADALFQLAVVMSQTGRDDEAHDAYAQALGRDPALGVARDALINAGRRDLLPETAIGPLAADRVLNRLDTQLGRLSQTLAELSAVSTFAAQSYDGFRRAFPIIPPPASDDAMGVRVLVDAVGATPDGVRRTLTSLLDQRFQNWRAVVVADADIADHPVASLGSTDARIRFIVGHSNSAIDPGVAAMALRAGGILDPEALGWMTYALARTSAAAVVCDHELYRPDWRKGAVRSTPTLLGMYDPFELSLGNWPGRAVLFRDGQAFAESSGDVMPSIQRALGRIDDVVVHLPIPLVAFDHDESEPLDPISEPVARGSETILVVIPTRDQPEMLQTGVAALRETAAHPDLLRIRIMDNRSRRPETLAALDELGQVEGIEVRAADEPFNWSRINNLGAGGSAEPLIVFANDDMESLTAGWDDRLRDWLARPEVGAVGARLLYPDRTVQHAGIVLGVDERPVHEGRHAPESEGGPMGRWRRSRPVAAVTGAFLACRRETFEAIGGFDERLAVAYNDIDFCLKVRERGLRVVFAADIELIHFESKTRGQNDTAARIAWDDAELTDLRARWDTWLSHDPGYNPQWATGPNRVFDGIGPLSLSRILAHLDASARSNPWSIDIGQSPGV